MTYEKKIEKLQRRIEWEYEEFVQTEMDSSSRKDIFDDCYRIAFYTAFYNYFDADDINPELVDLLIKEERPLEFLYYEYSDDDGIHLAYGQEDMENWLQFVCERTKNK